MKRYHYVVVDEQQSPIGSYECSLDGDFEGDTRGAIR